MVTKNVLSDLPGKLRGELFETLINNKNLKIERIVSPKDHKTPDGKWFNQDRDEFVILLQGIATLLFKDNNKILKLHPGDYINIPRNTVHRVESTDKEVQTIWLAVHYK